MNKKYRTGLLEYFILWGFYNVANNIGDPLLNILKTKKLVGEVRVLNTNHITFPT